MIYIVGRCTVLAAASGTKDRVDTASADTENNDEEEGWGGGSSYPRGVRGRGGRLASRGVGWGGGGASYPRGVSVSLPRTTALPCWSGHITLWSGPSADCHRRRKHSTFPPEGHRGIFCLLFRPNGGSLQGIGVFSCTERAHVSPWHICA